MGIKIDGVSIPLGGPGVGVPKGGSSGQVLIKKTDGNYDTEWANIPQATSEQLGLVKSSSGTDKVTVAEDGTMSVSQVSVAETALDASNAESANYALTCETASFAQQSVNPNLIPNGDMRRIVNQAGISWKDLRTGYSYVFENIYARNCQLSWSNGHLAYNPASTISGSCIEFGVEWGLGVSQTVTLSIIATAQSGTMLSNMVIQQDDVAANQLISPSFTITTTPQLFTFTTTINSNVKYLRLQLLWNHTDHSVDNIYLNGVKLEIGNHSTLGIIDTDHNIFITDPLKPYAQALLEVQRYMYMPLPTVPENGQWGYLCECMTNGGHEAYGTIHLPVGMYRVPTVEVNDISDFRFWCSLPDVVSTNIENVNFHNYATYGLQMQFVFPATINFSSRGFAGMVYFVQGTNPQTLVINAGIL